MIYRSCKAFILVVYGGGGVILGPKDVVHVEIVFVIF